MSLQSILSAALVLPSAAVLGAATPQAPDLSDPEVAHVAVTANTIDVEFGQLALERARSDRVKGFARNMIDAHTAVNERAAALAKELGVTPRTNAVSRSLKQGAAESRAKLEKLSGAEFDRAYIEREVAYHRAVIDAVDAVLIPTTETPELKKLLQEVRPALEAHLRMAEGIRDALMET